MFCTDHQNAVRVKERHLLKITPSEWIMEEKFKGIRVWLIKQGKERRLITRGHEDITAKFPHLIKIDWLSNLEIAQLDCELYDPEQEDEVVSGWANRKEIEPDHVENCILKVFDVLNLHGHNLAKLQQGERKTLLKKLRLGGALEPVIGMPADEHRSYYEHIITTPNKYGKRGEGIMLKKLSSPYIEGARRVNQWLKRKKRDPYDCVVIGFTKAKEGKFFGLVGAVTVGQFINGHLREICNVSGMDDRTRQDMTIDPSKYIGRACSIWAMEQDCKSLALIEPSWKGLRIDKRPQDCIYVPTIENEPEEDKLCDF